MSLAQRLYFVLSVYSFHDYPLSFYYKPHSVLGEEDQTNNDEPER